MRPETSSLDGLIFRPPSFVQPFRPAELFGREAALEVELGSGDGGFLAQWAALNPDHDFIGVERLLGRLRKLERKGRRAGLNNLRMLRIEAGYFLQYLLPRASVSALHIYFPDPWPKRKHHGRRLITPSFAQVVAETLTPSGILYLRTDDQPYFREMLECFSGDRFVSVPVPERLKEVMTDFERGFTTQGVPTLRAAYQRQSRPGAPP